MDSRDVRHLLHQQTTLSHHITVDIDKPLLENVSFLCQERTPDLLFHMKMPRVSEMFHLVAFLSQPNHQTIKPSHHKTINS